jgi:hypothetical protein
VDKIRVKDKKIHGSSTSNFSLWTRQAVQHGKQRNYVVGLRVANKKGRSQIKIPQELAEERRRASARCENMTSQ